MAVEPSETLAGISCSPVEEEINISITKVCWTRWYCISDWYVRTYWGQYNRATTAQLGKIRNCRPSFESDSVNGIIRIQSKWNHSLEMKLTLCSPWHGEALISLKNIHSVLERNEMEAWQKLIRVLTHEIMNSITLSLLSETLSERGVPVTLKYLAGEKEYAVMLQAMQTIHLT